jgi:type VI protein secretion system component VasF
MLPYRFNFETDEQYRDRVEQLQQNANQSVNTAVPQKQHSKLSAFLPWWFIGIFVVILLVYLYRRTQQKLMRKKQEEFRRRRLLNFRKRSRVKKQLSIVTEQTQEKAD